LREAIGRENLLDLIDPSFPPSVLVHGTADTIAPFSDSCELFKRLQVVGVQAQLFEVDGADHGIAPQVQYQKIFEDSVEALEGCLP
jgi:acetyl esterase/lipase